MNPAAEIQQKIIDREKLPSLLRQIRAAGKRIVFTNGCFDLLHPGHLHLLHTARQKGDLLITGLNTDDSVRRLKGADRPVMDEYSRALMLSAFFFVDHVVLFDEDSPIQLIRIIRPDILVKGGDYQKDDIVGADFVAAYGGKTIVIPFLKGFSSSGIIDKTRNL